MNQQITNFFDEVVLKYHLFNGLFLTLPFGDTEDTGMLLSAFAKHCQTELSKGRSLKHILNSFFKKQLDNPDEKIKIIILFKMLQYGERQIVLFDALEDAAFAVTHDLSGMGSLRHLIIKVKNKKQQNKFIKEIPDYRVRIVLTAHPTQFYPDPILAISTQLVEALHHNDLKQIRTLLLQMGKTSFKHQHKPTPYQEAHSLVWYLENIFYAIFPSIQSQIENAMISFGYKGKPLPSCIELGFWPGSDRDGNPNVTYQTTLAVAQLLKTRILKMYIHDLRQLVRKLTFAGILERLGKIKLKVEETYLYSQIEMSEGVQLAIYKNANDLLRDLLRLKKRLIEEHDSLFLESLDQLIIKVKCFGFYFSAMDMRENASELKNVFYALIKELLNDDNLIVFHKTLKNYRTLADEKKMLVLGNLLKQKITFKLSQQQNQQFRETIRSIGIIRPIQLQNGEKGLNRFIISNTKSALDVLELLTLIHIAGHFNGDISVDIIPLFESIVDLENAAQIMTSLYQCEYYQQHLKKRNRTQTIMLGFSDGTKDGGYVAANWSIYKAKLQLTAVSQQYGYRIVFFDGRGGPPARGGGNTHIFYRSLGSKISHRNLQLTVQGQTISANFGTHESAQYNIEQLVTAGLEDLIFAEEVNDLNDKEQQLIEQLSQESRKFYRSLKDNPLFIPYLEQMTPLKFYGELNIGSRPSMRKKSKQLQFTDLRAIPFVGSWNQLKQNVPGYYGFGFALQQLIAQGKTEELMRLYQHSLFFRTLVENTMMSLCKTFFGLTSYMKNDKIFGSFWQQLASEAELTKQLLLHVSGQRQLLENDVLNRESIKLREEIVLPLLVIQQFAMLRLQELVPKERKLSTIYKKIILKALAANTNASRNSA